MYLTLKEVERNCSRPGACIPPAPPIKGQIVIIFGLWGGRWSKLKLLHSFPVAQKEPWTTH